MSETTTDNGTIITEHGEIIAEGMQIAEFNPDSVVDNYVFEYRFNCQAGKTFLGDSKKRVISVENETESHEFAFTFIAFQKISPSAGFAMLSPKHSKTREWGQIIGIDKDGLIFSSFIKTYMLGSLQSLIEGFIYDVQTKKETGSLVGRLVKVDFGKATKTGDGDFFMPSAIFLKDTSVFADKAKELAAAKRQGSFSFPTPNLIKI